MRYFSVVNKRQLYFDFTIYPRKITNDTLYVNKINVYQKILSIFSSTSKDIKGERYIFYIICNHSEQIRR